MEIPRGDDKGAGAADHVAAVIRLQPRLLGEDREPVDRDPRRDDAVARHGRRQPEIGHPIAGDVDDPARRRLGRMVERGSGGEQCRTDRGQPFGTPLHRTDGSGKGGGALCVREPRPPDRDRDAVGIRPFENQGFDAPRNSRDRADEPAVLERTRNAVALQQIGIGRHTGRHVDGEH